MRSGRVEEHQRQEGGIHANPAFPSLGIEASRKRINRSGQQPLLPHCSSLLRKEEVEGQFSHRPHTTTAEDCSTDKQQRVRLPHRTHKTHVKTTLSSARHTCCSANHSARISPHLLTGQLAAFFLNLPQLCDAASVFGKSCVSADSPMTSSVFEHANMTHRRRWNVTSSLIGKCCQMRALETNEWN